MKNKFPTLAAILLLATAATRADDLLDAVLWDGPSAFPSKAAPAPEPPPPPAPEPAPAPVYPSRSSYTLRPPAPEPAPPPAAPNSAAVESVPDAVDPVPHSGDTQIRREIKEMRARADRLEAALGPTAVGQVGSDEPPSSPTRLPSFSFSARGGAGRAGVAYLGSVELAMSIGDTPFDVSVRGFLLGLEGSHTETYYASWLGRTESFTDHDDEKHFGGAAELIWRPFRESHFSPFAGIGGRYEHTKIDRDKREGRASLSGRVGAVLSVPGFERLSLKGEFLAGADSNELVGEVGLRLWSHFVLNGFVESFDIDLGRATAYGGGMTLLF